MRRTLLQCKTIFKKIFMNLKRRILLFFVYSCGLLMSGCQPDTPDTLVLDHHIWTRFKLDKFQVSLPSVYNEDQLKYSSDTTPERKYDGQLITYRYPFYKSFHAWLSYVTSQHGAHANKIVFDTPTITLHTYHDSIKSEDKLELRFSMNIINKNNKKTVTSIASEVIPSSCSLEYRSYIEQKLFYSMLSDIHGKISIILRNL